jgi:hypothetical protein
MYALCNAEIECLQTYLHDTRRVLEPKCKSMLLGRMAMFRNADMVSLMNFFYLPFYKAKIEQ